jgi:hypothetical protein
MNKVALSKKFCPCCRQEIRLVRNRRWKVLGLHIQGHWSGKWNFCPGSFKNFSKALDNPNEILFKVEIIEIDDKPVNCI